MLRFPKKKTTRSFLTVRLLEASASAASTELLGFTAAGISDEECAVVPDEDILDLLLRLLINVLLVERHQGLGNALADSVDLGDVTAALHADPHVNSGEAVAPEEKDGLVRLVPEDLRLNQLDGAPVDLDQPTAALAVGHSHRVLLPPEALHGLYGRRRRHCRRSR
ncbi:unnamed protein product [Spirodela intermedia]|uniref:Uncharacterized protein n=2 Tax=Spirodela intermedia TaxID=51605 RepID=A0A7I8J4X9_SPIIN|nr:unnamed protein product [Spirodela intermedia]CAA6665298.1 unnamed protein product [Spirodela intermedia]CAA7402025.1 unnamed protein product [Spirodela intermedia]